MNRIHCLLLSSLLFLIFNTLQAGPDLETIRKRVISELMLVPVNDEHIRNLTETLTPEGTWPGIDYTDVSRTGFQHWMHLDNLITLCHAFRKNGSEYKNNKQLKLKINTALDYWLKNDFICENWWYNQIGTPDQMVRIMLLLDNDLTKEQSLKCLEIAGRANMNASGARPSGDRIKIAGILAKNALYQKNDSLFGEVIRIIEGEIKISDGPGLQPDLSFQHRPDKVISTLSYGLGYADAFAEWAVYVEGTGYSFSEKSLDLLIDFYLDGICQSMAYGRYPDPGAMNRDISRVGAMEAFDISTPGKLLKTSYYRKSELERIISVRQGKKVAVPSRIRFFPVSEYFTCQRPGYFTSVRMYSSRNHNMEMPYNSEGLMNHHYADGSNFISRKGNEYFNITPVYDWQKIPGTTIVQKPSLPPEKEIQKRGITEFVGAVTDGLYGAAVFDFSGLIDPLRAKKAWFFFDRQYVCLGASVASESEFPVVTTLNQCRLNGDVIVSAGGSRSVLPLGLHELDNVSWILHDSIAYLFPEPIALKLSNTGQKGSWYLINRQSESPREEISAGIFKLWIDHGVRPAGAVYQYIVMPSASEDDLSNTGENNEVRILSDNPSLQAVFHTRLNLIQAVFHSAGELQFSPSLKIVMDSPGLIMLGMEGRSVKSITVADPSRKLGKIHLALSGRMERHGRNFDTFWNEEEGLTEIAIDLPRGGQSGESVTINIK